MFKHMGAVILIINMFLNLSFKTMTGFATVAGNTVCTSKFVYQERLKFIRIRTLYEK